MAGATIKVTVDSDELEMAIQRFRAASFLVRGRTFMDGYREFWRGLDGSWKKAAGFTAGIVSFNTMGAIARWLWHQL